MVARTNNSQNQLTSVGQNALTYDNNGNTTTDDFGRTLIFDAWNRLVAVNDSSSSVTYIYDGLNRRIGESSESSYESTDWQGDPIVVTVEGATNLYYSAQGQVISEQQSTITWDGPYSMPGVNSANYQYVWSPVYVNALVLRDNTFGPAERIYALQDANFNTTVAIASQGPFWVVGERFVYDSYGQSQVFDVYWTPSNDAFHWTYKFQGMHYDERIGLYFSQGRPYSPTLDRWISQDIFYFDGPNLYSFVICNPISYTDATGLAAVSPEQFFNDLFGVWFNETKPSLGGARWDKGTLGITDTVHFDPGNPYSEALKNAPSMSGHNVPGVLSIKDQFFSHIAAGDHSNPMTLHFNYSYDSMMSGAYGVRSVENFLGSYEAQVKWRRITGCDYSVDITVTNTSGWFSASRFPHTLGINAFAQLITALSPELQILNILGELNTGNGSLYKNHPRGIRLNWLGKAVLSTSLFGIGASINSALEFYWEHGGTFAQVFRFDDIWSDSAKTMAIGGGYA